MTYEWLAPIRPYGPIYVERRGFGFFIVQMNTTDSGEPLPDTVLYAPTRSVEIEASLVAAREVQWLSRRLTQ